jgi:GH15 family glucan-1,4-alpha-glucosidase
MELCRPVRSWEFLASVGTRAALFGNESGRMEAWVYPLKLFRNFQLQFHAAGHALPAESLARTVIVRPESSTVIYASDTFSVRETFFVPVHDPGVIILLDVETEEPLDIEASFQRDFQLEWPGVLGGAYSYWDAAQRAFFIGEEQRKYAALVGSPTAQGASDEYHTNYSESPLNSFRLGVTAKGKDTKVIVMTGSVDGRAAAENSYHHLATDYDALLRESADYYRNYLSRSVTLELPDNQIQQAYDWARVSMVQGVVSNPFLGTGLIAGYGTSGKGQRPGFAWFFGRDALWTSLALNASGDFANTRTALDFLSKYQRDDGKIPHEVAQSATLVPWFANYPYPYASADATPLYLIAMNDYVVESGDVSFVLEKWTSIWKAYEFLRTTYDAHGFPRNFGIGHGWVESGPLLPVQTEIYQAALGTESLRALDNLARLAGKNAESKGLAKEFERQKSRLNADFWVPGKDRYAFALDQTEKPLDEASVLTAVPMWFGLLDEKYANATIKQLADSDHQTDWGMRIISNLSPKFNGGGYHFGSVWPLFTGWASVGEYRYHRGLPAFENLRANSLLVLDGSLGHVTEVLSGDYYEPLATSSPHQIWSAAMVVSPILRGLFGLQTDAIHRSLTFAPHVPGNWRSFAIRNVPACRDELDFSYTKSSDVIKLRVERKSTENYMLEFEPAVSLRAKVLGVDINGHAAPFRIVEHDTDQHVLMRLPVNVRQSVIQISLRNDFQLSYDASLPPLGTTSRQLRFISESWTPSRDSLTLELAGIAGSQYQLGISDGSQITSIDGGQLVKAANQQQGVLVRFPAHAADSYVHTILVFHFRGATTANGAGP